MMMKIGAIAVVVVGAVVVVITCGGPGDFFQYLRMRMWLRIFLPSRVKPQMVEILRY